MTYIIVCILTFVKSAPDIIARSRSLCFTSMLNPIKFQSLLTAWDVSGFNLLLASLSTEAELKHKP
jgi:hypothetical protein